MKSDSYSVLERANELAIRRRRRCGEMSGAHFAIDGKEPAECELESASVTPCADGVGERCWLSAALQAEAGEGVRHDAFSQAGIDGSE
jgi:hypothetical protein